MNTNLSLLSAATPAITLETSKEKESSALQETAPKRKSDKEVLDITLHIFQFLDASNWNKFSLTNKFYYAASRDESIIITAVHQHKDINKRIYYAKMLGRGELTELDLSSSTLTGSELRDFHLFCRNIKKMNLSHCDKLAFVSLYGLCGSLKQLKSLNLKDNRFPSYMIQLIIKGFPSITVEHNAK